MQATSAASAAGLALAMPQCWQPAATQSPAIPATTTPVAPLRITLDGERFSVFTALAAIEKRPVEEIIEESLAMHAAHLLRTRHALHFDPPYDAQVLAEYIDGLAARQEAWEHLETESAARATTTPAMRQAAAAADERERHPEPDLEEWDRALPFGHVEIALAIEG